MGTVARVVEGLVALRADGKDRHARKEAEAAHDVALHHQRPLLLPSVVESSVSRTLHNA